MIKHRHHIYISEDSINNIVRELNSLRDLILNEEDCDSRADILQEGIEEISYNISLLSEGVNYLSDEFFWRAQKVKECE
jgi:hypothetical protein